MSIKSAQSVTVLFSTQVPSTGAASDADALPSGTLYVNGTANGAAVTVENITTGVYKAAVTLPSLSAGDLVALRIAATVDSVAGEAVIWQDVADTSRASDVATTVGAAGAGLTALGDARLANLDAAVSGRSTLAAGAKMDLVDAPNATAVTAIQSGLATGVAIAALPAAVWTYTTRTLTSLSALVASIAAAVWAYATRTLTQSAVSVAAAVAGSDVSVQQAVTWSVGLTGLGSVADRDNLVLMVKDDIGDTDAQAILWVDEDTGLIRLNGAAATEAQVTKATLEVDDEDAGDITLTVSSDIAAAIPVKAGRVYAVKVMVDGDPMVADRAASGTGSWDVTAIVPRATS